MNALITIAILVAGILYLARAEHKRLERAAARDALNRARATDPQPVTQAELTADRERLIAAIRDDHCACRDGVRCERHEREQADWELWAAEVSEGSEP